MEPESKRHTMSHPPENVSNLESNLRKSGKLNKNDKKKVRFNYIIKKKLNFNKRK